MPTPPHLRAVPPNTQAVEEPDLRGHVARALASQYVLGAEIGRGGMGVVYRARDLRLDREVAIKVLPPELAYDPAIRTRFTAEARIAAQLGHPHIVPIHDVGELEGVAYFVMALVSGENLAAKLARDPRPPIEETRRILGEIADALAYAHRRGVVHRDVKPDNVLLDAESGRAVVTDFGIARAIEAGTRVTVTGMAVGTPSYMSPEQALGERELDGRSDVYALGVLAWQMLTGRLPFTAGNAVAVLLKHVNEPPRPIAELRPDVPRGLRETVERALAKSPDDRWPTAAAFRDALERDDHLPVWRRPSALSAAAPAAAGFSPELRAELRLWRGRVDLLDRIRAFRLQLAATLAATPLALLAFVVAFVDAAPPLVLAPAIPAWMAVSLVRRARSLRASGLQIRRVALMPRAAWALAGPPPPRPAGVPADVLRGPHGATVKRAAEDRAAILELVRQVPEADRAVLAEVAPTANALLDRAVRLARAIERVDRVGPPARELPSWADDRARALLDRQQMMRVELAERRAALASHLESAGLALGNLRLDLVKLASSGVGSTLGAVTGEARALSRDIGALLDAAAEIERL